MANIRREFGDDLTLKNGSLGINTTTAQERVDVVGVVKGRDLNATGVSSLTAYEGFLRADNQIVEDTTLEFGNGLKASLSGEIIVKTGQTVTIGAVGLGTTSVGVGTHTIQSNIDTTDVNLAGGSQVECLKVFNTFTPPSGGTNDRPYKPKPGQLYYNYDFKTIEFHDGNGWRQVDNTTRSGRGVFVAGYDGATQADTDYMTYIQVSTLGNSLDFGTLNGNDQGSRRAGCSNGTRGLAGGGTPNSTHIDYLTIAVGGGSQDFGDLTVGRYAFSSCSSSTRGVWMAGYQHPAGSKNEIDYVEIATLGNALDFGDTTSATHGICATSSPTRGFCFGLGSNSYPYGKGIDMITFASKGNAIDFGECQNGIRYAAAGSDNTRAVIGGRQGPGTVYAGEVMQRFDMTSGGNALNFGNLTASREAGSGAVTNGTRAVFGGGFTDPNASNISNVMDYTVIQSSGNAIDFGDMQRKQCYYAAISDTHGGLGGF